MRGSLAVSKMNVVLGPISSRAFTKGTITMQADTQIEKNDIVEHLATGQTWRVVSNVNGTLRVKGNGMSTTLLLRDVKKAPPRA
jgi:hypothetical protein